MQLQPKESVDKRLCSRLDETIFRSSRIKWTHRMGTSIVVIIIIIEIVVISVTAIHQQPICGSVDDVVFVVEHNYAFRRVSSIWNDVTIRKTANIVLAKMTVLATIGSLHVPKRDNRNWQRSDCDADDRIDDVRNRFLFDWVSICVNYHKIHTFLSSSNRRSKTISMQMVSFCNDVQKMRSSMLRSLQFWCSEMATQSDDKVKTTKLFSSYFFLRNDKANKRKSFHDAIVLHQRAKGKKKK